MTPEQARELAESTAKLKRAQADLDRALRALDFVVTWLLVPTVALYVVVQVAKLIGWLG